MVGILNVNYKVSLIIIIIIVILNIVNYCENERSRTNLHIKLLSKLILIIRPLFVYVHIAIGIISRRSVLCNHGNLFDCTVVFFFFFLIGINNFRGNIILKECRGRRL